MPPPFSAAASAGRARPPRRASGYTARSTRRRCRVRSAQAPWCRCTSPRWLCPDTASPSSSDLAPRGLAQPVSLSLPSWLGGRRGPLRLGPRREQVVTGHYRPGQLPCEARQLLGLEARLLVAAGVVVPFRLDV